MNLKMAVLQSQEGDHSAFRALFDMLHDRVFKYVLSRSSSREDAKDLTQEVFCDLWTALRRFRYRSDAEFYGFLFTIARRKLAGHYRSRDVTVEFDEAFVQASYELPYEDYRKLTEQIARLNPRFQEVLRLRYWTGLPWAEVAAVMNRREGTVKVWHNRALRALQRSLNRYEKQ